MYQVLQVQILFLYIFQKHDESNTVDAKKGTV